MENFEINLKKIKSNAEKHMLKGSNTKSKNIDTKALIEVLNDALATEIICTLRYKQNYFLCKGIKSEIVAAEFNEHAQQEQEHIDLLAKRITQLGGRPDFDPKSFVSRAHSDYTESRTLKQMIKDNLIAERVAVEIYTAMIKWIGHSDPTTRRLLEDILKQEEEHADEMADFYETCDENSQLHTKH